VHGPATAFNVYKSSYSSAVHPAPSSILLQHPLARFFDLIMRCRPLPTQAHSGRPLNWPRCSWERQRNLFEVQNPRCPTLDSMLSSLRTTIIPLESVGLVEIRVWVSSLRPPWLSHSHDFHDNALSVIMTVQVCFGSAFMRCDLANGRNTSQRRGWLRAWLRRGITCQCQDLGEPACAVETLICAVCLDLDWPATRRADSCLRGCRRLRFARQLHYRSLSWASCRTNTKRRQWEDWREAGQETWTITSRRIVRPREELGLKLLHIGRIDPALGCCSRNHTCRQNASVTIYATQSHFCKGQVVWAQLYGDGHQPHATGVMHWISSRSGGSQTGRSLHLRWSRRGLGIVWWTSPGRSLEGLRFHAQDQISSFPESLWHLRVAMLVSGRDPSNSDKQAFTNCHLSCSIPLPWRFHASFQLLFFLPLRFFMAALQSTFVHFALPLPDALP